MSAAMLDEISYADISNDIVDEWMTTYPEYLSKGRAVPDGSYFYCFNFRAGAGDAERIKIWKDSGWEPDNWDKAIANANFRHAIMSAFNRDYAMYAMEPDEATRAEITQRTITPRTFTGVDGVDFSQLPQFSNVDQYFYNEAEAIKYKDAAVAELTAAGVTLPVKVVLGYRSDQSDWENEVTLVKQQLEGVLGTDFIECVLYAGPADSFLTQVRRNGMYGFMRCNWYADYEDPSTWSIGPFAIDDSTIDGVVKANSYNDMDYVLYEGSKNDLTPIMEAYYAKLDEAKAIPDTAPRYAAFAEAEAMLIENAVMIPFYIQPASYRATKLDIFEGQYAPCGVSNLRYKYQSVKDHYITMDEYHKAAIDYSRCISCGACTAGCPFGAITDRSRMVDVIRAIRAGKKVCAIFAPAIEGHFGTADVGVLKEAIRRLGFHTVLEVSLGADATAYHEAQELKQALSRGFQMTTSCCPAFVEMIEKHFPKLTPFVSGTASPMTMAARYLKREDPDALVAFIGPCVAKKLEIKKAQDTADYVLTFEELAAMFQAKKIDIASIEVQNEQDGSLPGKNFAVSGGVSSAVETALKEENFDQPFTCVKCNGAKECKKILMMMNAGRLKENLVEGMACEGGCVAGPGGVEPVRQVMRNRQKLLASADRRGIRENLEQLHDLTHIDARRRS